MSVSKASFISELKRRNVIRMAGLYMVGAWLIMQVSETLLPIFDTPAWVLKAMVYVLAIGFLPVLAFSWIFELTPEGLKRDSEVDQTQSIAPQTAHRMERVIIALFTVALLFFVFDRFVLAPKRDAALAVAVTNAATSKAQSGEVSSNAKSIAVLPFVNMSSDKEQEFFSDGMTEEILNALANVTDLKVAGRTSSFYYKGKNESLTAIGKALGVANVLEGSVRKQGNTVRITAQLIRTSDGFHLWSQTYDRDLIDVFKVQEEIAQAISDELVGLLPVGKNVNVSVATDDMTAYERFLRGRTRFFKRSELKKARDDLAFAVERDPKFGEAWVYLAATHYVLPGYETDINEKESYLAMNGAMERAEHLLPKHPLLLALRGNLLVERNKMAEGLDILAQAAAMPSTDSTPKLWYGNSLMVVGYANAAIPVLEQAISIDPLSGINHGYLGTALFMLRDDKRGAVEMALADSQGWSYGQLLYGWKLITQGQRNKGLALCRSLVDETNPGSSSAGLNAFEKAVLGTGDKKAYLDLLPPDTLDESLFALGLSDRILERWLAITKVDPTLGGNRYVMRIFWQPEYAAVWEDPRFFTIAERTGLVALWQARGYPFGCKPLSGAGSKRLQCPKAMP